MSDVRIGWPTARPTGCVRALGGWRSGRALFNEKQVCLTAKAQRQVCLTAKAQRQAKDLLALSVKVLDCVGI